MKQILADKEGEFEKRAIDNDSKVGDFNYSMDVGNQKF
ncbi:hypothetical protein F442_11530 [Phytophthora nicotianae P10297]|uniref:Uncharacterized protein n=1 Tax=Phytophthora nicotianae P10297 TaxID=1317064 RepID=W2Z2U6_PHYNI|nr:hypothetical protein F442_11530 [Phytophthora nicotianae P10297]